ncbi:hypothetical protein [Bacillus pseudomycoides]|nr:hypothetical protein [Bacillus pseudomycoides]
MFATVLCVVGALSLALNVGAVTKEDIVKEQVQYMVEPGGL